MFKDEQHESRGALVSDAIRSLTRMTLRRPKTSLFVLLLLAGVAAVYSVGWMRFKTDRSDLIDPDAVFQQRWQNYTESFGESNEIVVAVESADPEEIKAVLEDLGARMSREPEIFANILYRIEPGKLRSKGLQYLSPGQLESGLHRVEEYQPILRGRWDLLQFDALLRRLRIQIESRFDRGQDIEPLLAHTELLSRSMAHYVRDPSDFRNPWPDVVPIDPRMRDSGQQVVYLMNDSGTMGFLKAVPVQNEKSFNGATDAIARLNLLLGEVRSNHPTVRLSTTGIPILENDEMRDSQADMWVASLISVIGVGVILFVGFRGFRHPLLAMLMLAVAMAWAFGYTTLTIGHLNILSVSFAAILIGLGIDFSIHYLARYLELRHENEMLRPALLATSGSVGTGIVTAALTTALAFFCASFTPFLGVAELGIIAGGGILLCALATFLVLPALVSLSDQSVEPKKLPTLFEGRLLRAAVGRQPWLVLLLSVGGLIGVGLMALDFGPEGIDSRVRYDSNLLNLQAEGLESVELQKRIFNDAQHSLLYAVSLADSPQEARALRRKFEALPTVHHVEEMGSRIPGFRSDETKLLVQAFRAQLARLPERPPVMPAPSPTTSGQEIERLYALLKTLPQSSAFESRKALDSFLDDFDRLTGRNQQSFLNAYQYRMQAALLGQFQALYAASNPEPVTMADLPAELTSRFVSNQGKWLVQIYPREQIWDVEPLGRFVEEVRSIDPEVTGTPLQNYEASRQIRDSYQQAAIYALLAITLVLLLDMLEPRYKLAVLLPTAIAVILIGVVLKHRKIDVEPMWLALTALVMTVTIAALLDFRNCRDAILAMLPPLGGMLLMFGFMGLLGVDLNPANLIVLPLILGIGVDDGVHVIHDYRQQRQGYRTSSSTINAIVLTSLTSMVGFGSMMVASHRGLHSVGLVLVIGVGSCLLVSLVTLPALLTIIGRSESSASDEEQTERQPSQRKFSKAA